MCESVFRCAVAAGAATAWVGVVLPVARGQDVRVANYNTEADVNGVTAPRTGLSTVLEAMGEANTSAGNVATAHPLDIIGLEETTSNAATVAPIVTSLNSFYGAANVYAQSTYQGTESGNDPTTGNGPNAIIYNTSTMSLLSSTGIGMPTGATNGEYRQVVRYEFQPVGGNASQDFYVYVSHMKSSASGTTADDQTARGEEAAIIRTNEDSLGSGASFLTMGDFNLDSSGEAAYTTLTATATASSHGQNVDEKNLSNASISFTGSGYTANETDSVSTLKYRDDIQFQSTNISSGTSTAIKYLANSYRVFGNNNTVAYQGAVNASSNTALSGLSGSITGSAAETALTTASDHYPVVVDYTLASVPEPIGVAFATLSAVAILPRRRRSLLRLVTAS